MKLGLIAGNGRFPFMVLQGARHSGVDVAVAAIREETDPEIEQVAERFIWVGIGQLGRMIRFFKEEGVEKAIMAGQVKHVQIFSRAVPDARMLKVLLKLPRRNTDSLIGAIASELQSEGIELIDSTHFLQDYLPERGTLTRRQPEQRELEDIAYGLEIAREIARLDLGQTIVVRGKACVAIEAMEGTDETIRRAGKLTRGGKAMSDETGPEPNSSNDTNETKNNQQRKGGRLTGFASSLIRGRLPDLSGGRLTVVKIAKPDQDMRFDVPVVGVTTIEAMIDAGATCLCLAAGKTLMFDRVEMIGLAEASNIAIIAV